MKQNIIMLQDHNTYNTVINDDSMSNEIFEVYEPDENSETQPEGRALFYKIITKRLDEKIPLIKDKISLFWKNTSDTYKDCKSGQGNSYSKPTNCNAFKTDLDGFQNNNISIKSFYNRPYFTLLYDNKEILIANKTTNLVETELKYISFNRFIKKKFIKDLVKNNTNIQREEIINLEITFIDKSDFNTLKFYDYLKSNKRDIYAISYKANEQEDQIFLLNYNDTSSIGNFGEFILTRFSGKNIVQILTEIEGIDPESKYCLNQNESRESSLLLNKNNIQR